MARAHALARALSGCQAMGSQPLQSNAAMGTNLPESSAVIARVTCAVLSLSGGPARAAPGLARAFGICFTVMCACARAAAA
jgi:hypothetical protein